MDRDLEQLWPAAEPPPGFAERVVEGALSEPSPVPRQSLPRRASRARAPRSWARLALAVLALSALLAASFVGWQLHRHEHGEVFAAEPQEVAIGQRATALLSRGAHLWWSAATTQQGQPVQRVQQDRGDVEYRVHPGGPFVVQTPFGVVQVLGTIFRVHVAGAEATAARPEEQSMKASKRAIAATALTTGALLYVGVREGTVRLSNADQQIVLAQGEAGTIGADGIPMRVDPMVAVPDESEVASEPRALRQPEGQRGAFDRHRADGVRQRAAVRNAAHQAQASAAPPGSAPQPGSASTPAAPEPPPAMTAEEEEHRRVYIRNAVREQYFPIARSCYEELLARQPKAKGRIMMSFAIVGDGDAGVVDRVEFGEGTTMDDPEFTLCMRESMYSTVFEPPPSGTQETTVVYPLELDPGEPEDVAQRQPLGKVQQESH
jgi:hypothetical protein